MPYAGKVAGVWAAIGPAVAFAQEPLEEVEPGLVYRIADRAKAYWPPEAAVSLERSGDGGQTWQAVTSGYSVEHVGGYVRFSVPQTGLFRASGQYLPMEQVGGAFNWTVEPDVEYGDCTAFDSQGWREFEPLLKTWAATCELWWASHTWIRRQGAEAVFVFYLDTADPQKPRLEGYGLLPSVPHSVAVDALIRQSISFRGTGPLYARRG